MLYEVPKISIIMPLYNKEAEINRAIKSVFAQTVKDFELVIINDGSTDKGPELVRDIRDPRIRVIDQKNAGVSAARNRGIQEVRSDLIAFLDADDEWKPDFLETILTLRKNYPVCSVFATNYIFRRKNDYSRSTIIRGLPRGFKEGILTDYFKIASQSDPPLWTSAVAVTKKAMEAVGGFPEGVISGEDLLTWARLAVRFEVAYTTEQKAYFWEPIIVSDRPGRIPDMPDIVGQELQNLLKTVEGAKSNVLKTYIALWHKMRASAYIQLGERREALKEIQKAVFFSGFTLKLFVYSGIALLPNSISIGLFEFMRRVSALNRKSNPDTFKGLKNDA
ncbi:MAG: glycosyltransferase family 2 protein [Thermodesulfovibrionales bacterium]